MPDLLHRPFTSWRSNIIRISTYLGITLYRKGIVPRSLIGTINTLTTGCKEMVYYLYYKKFHIREQRVQVDNERLSQVHGTLSKYF